MADDPKARRARSRTGTREIPRWMIMPPVRTSLLDRLFSPDMGLVKFALGVSILTATLASIDAQIPKPSSSFRECMIEALSPPGADRDDPGARREAIERCSALTGYRPDELLRIRRDEPPWLIFDRERRHGPASDAHEGGPATMMPASGSGSAPRS